jgi:hypothetical protein
VGIHPFGRNSESPKSATIVNPQPRVRVEESAKSRGHGLFRRLVYFKKLDLGQLPGNVDSQPPRDRAKSPWLPRSQRRRHRRFL